MNVPIICHACGRTTEVPLSTLGSIDINAQRCACGSTDIDVNDIETTAGDRFDRWRGDRANRQHRKNQPDGVPSRDAESDAYMNQSTDPHKYHSSKTAADDGGIYIIKELGPDGRPFQDDDTTVYAHSAEEAQEKLDRLNATNRENWGPDAPDRWVCMVVRPKVAGFAQQIADNEWNDAFTWAMDLADGHASLVGFDRPGTPFSTWKNKVIDDYLTHGDHGMSDGDGFGSSDGNHVIFPALKAAKANGVGSLMALDEFVRDYLGLSHVTASKRTAAQQWFVIQRGTFVKSGGPYDSEADAASAAASLNAQYGTNEYMAHPMTPVTDGNIDLPAPGTGYFKGSKTADITAVDGPMRFLKPDTTGKEYARCSRCFAQFEHVFQDAADKIPPCPVCGHEATSTAGSSAWAVTATKAIVARRAKRQAIASAVMRANPGMSRNAAYVVAQATIQRYPKVAGKIIVERDSPFHTTLVARGWGEGDTDASHGTAFVTMNEPTPASFPQVVEDNGQQYRPAPEPLAFGQDTTLNSGRANAVPAMANEADGNETKRKTAGSDGNIDWAAQSRLPQAQMPASIGSPSNPSEGDWREGSMGSLYRNFTPASTFESGVYGYASPNAIGDYVWQVLKDGRDFASGKEDTATAACAAADAAVSSSTTSSYRISIETSLRGVPHLAVADMTAAQWSEQRPLLEAQGKAYLVEVIQG